MLHLKCFFNLSFVPAGGRCHEADWPSPGSNAGAPVRDFLVVRNIRNEIETEADGSCSIWIIEDDQLAAAAAWLGKFRANPEAAEFRAAAVEADRVRKAEMEDRQNYQRRIRSRRSLFVKFGGYGVGVLTCVFIGLCAAVAFSSRLGQNRNLLDKLFISNPDQPAAGFLPDVFQHGEFWRLLTPIFIHFGMLHLLFNMFWFYDLGGMIETRQSSLRLLLLVAVTGVFSNVLQYIVAGPEFGGMSGVVYGLAGYVWMRGRYDRASGLQIHPQSVAILLVWLVVCFTGLVGSVANFAHLGGLASGMALGRVSAYLALRRPEK